MTDTMLVSRFEPLAVPTGEPLKLSMQSLWLTGRLLPFGARLWVRHEFQSQEKKPVEVVYCFALPRDAALRRFRVSGEGFSVHSELRRTADAVRIYEEGIRGGSLSTLARQYGDGLINLTVGNIRPQEKVVVSLELLAGVELRDDGLRFRFPFTVAPSYHPQARAITLEPGQAEMELPAEEFGDLMLPRFVASAEGLHQVGFALAVQMGAEIIEIGSPSHALRVQNDGGRRSLVSLAREGDLPDRDLVLDVRPASNGAAVLAGTGQDGKGHFAAVIPSHHFGNRSAGPRRVAMLLDRSGSMQGAPIAQAKKAIEACLAALDPKDFFGLVVFDNQSDGFQPQLVESTMENRRAAEKFLHGIDARGGTELATGVEAAAELLKGEQGDVLILTDGQVFATETILAKARATGARLHCLGIGSASQGRFLSHLASETGGVCRFLTPRERVDLSAVELFASIGRPVAREVKVSVRGIEGSRVAPDPPCNVFSGTPLLVFGEALAGGDGYLHVGWKHAEAGGQLKVPVHIEKNALADTLRLVRGAKLISDLESRYLPADRQRAAARKESTRTGERLAQLSEEYGLVSAEMSLVAVVKRAGDQPGDIPKTEIVAVGMPQDTAFSGVFALGSFTAVAQTAPGALPAARAMGTYVCDFGVGEVVGKAKGLTRLFHTKLGRAAPAQPVDFEEEAAGRAGEAATLLVLLAGSLEADGGMPGKTEEARLVNSLAALLYFAQDGNSRKAGTFRMHVERLTAFLELQPLDSFDPDQRNLVVRVLAMLAGGNVLKGDWRPHAVKVAANQDVAREVFWKDLADAVFGRR